MQAIYNLQQRVWPEIRQDLKWSAVAGAVSTAAATYAHKLAPATVTKLFTATTAQLALRTLLPWRLAQRYLPEGTRFTFIVCVLMSTPVSFLGGMVAPIAIVGAGIAAAKMMAKPTPVVQDDADRELAKLELADPKALYTAQSITAANVTMVAVTLGLGFISPLGAVCTLLAPPIGRKIAQAYTRLTTQHPLAGDDQWGVVEPPPPKF